MGKNKDLTETDKLAIVNVRSYFEKERNKIRRKIKSGKLKKADFPMNFTDVVQRTCDALKVSRPTVKRVTQEFKKNGKVGRSEKHKSGRRKIVLDSFGEGVVRRVVLEFYAKKEFPTLAMIHSTLMQDANFPKMTDITLLNIMKKQLKFKFIQFQGKPVPLEREDIKLQRYNYLREIRRLRAEGYKIYYQDESWCNAHQSPKRGWHMPGKEILGIGNGKPQLDIWLKGVGHRFTDNLVGGISSKPSGAGERIIMIEIGSEDGFLGGLGDPFIGKSRSVDYHDAMNTLHFNEWFEKVIAQVPVHSVIVVDRAKYHREVTPETKGPTTKWKKAALVEFLVKRKVGIPSPYHSFQEMTRKILLPLCRQHKIPEEFQIEVMAKNSGKDVKILWLPIAHCELNAIELIWSYVKRQVSLRNKTFKIAEVLAHSIDILKSDAVKELWTKCVRHVKDLEQKIMEIEVIADEFLLNQVSEIIIPNTGDSSDSDSSDSDSARSSDSDSENSSNSDSENLSTDTDDNNE